MKVLYANKFFFLNGGSETVMFQERTYMLEHGVEVVDFSMQDERNLASNYSEYFVRPLSYRQGPLGARLSAARSFVHSKEAVEKITALAKKTRPDIAHLHNIYHQLTPSIIPALKKLGIKTALTLHDGKVACPAYLMLSNGKPCLDCKGSRFYLPFMRNCQCSRLGSLLLSAEAYYHKWKKSYEAVDMFIAPSAFIAGVAEPRVGKQKLTVLHNGIDVTKYTPSRADEGYILYLGRLSHEKGIQTLIKAHAAMSLNPKPELRIVGTGPLEAELRTAAPAGVSFTGYCSGEALLNHIRMAACLVIPSEWYENCSMTVLEAMASGKPIIGSRMGGIPEQVEDGVNGFLCEAGKVPDFAAALDKLMASPELRRRMGEAARAKAEAQYSLEEHNRKLLKIYETLITDRN